MIKTINKIKALVSQTSWKQTYIQAPLEGKLQRVTLIPGKAIGPEICGSVQQVFEACHVPIEFDILNEFKFEDSNISEKLKKNKNIIVGVPTFSGQKYFEPFQFFKQLDLFANITIGFSVPGLRKQRHQNVNIVVIRENTEGEFSGIEHEVYPGVIESLKVTTKQASLKIAEYAFEFAHLSGRSKVTAVHKANIMKLVDGLFLKACREVANKYPFIKYEEMIIDNCCMQLVKNPQQFDVMVMPNLYGSIVQNIVAGITGGVGMTPGASAGKDHMLFGQGTRHSGYDIAGQNVVNPSALLLSSVFMLRSMGLYNFANKIQGAVIKTVSDGEVLTQDLGGKSTCSDFTNQVIKNL